MGSIFWTYPQIYIKMTYLLSYLWGIFGMETQDSSMSNIEKDHISISFYITKMKFWPRIDFQFCASIFTEKIK